MRWFLTLGLLSCLFAPGAFAQDPTEGGGDDSDPPTPIPPPSTLPLEVEAFIFDIDLRIAQVRDAGVLGIDALGWERVAAGVSRFLRNPDPESILAVDGTSWDLVAIDQEGWDLVAVEGTGWGFFLLRTPEWSLCGFRTAFGTIDVLAVNAAGWDLVAGALGPFDLLAVRGMSADELEIRDDGWDLVAVDDAGWDLVALEGPGKIVGTGRATGVGNVANGIFENVENFGMEGNLLITRDPDAAGLLGGLNRLRSLRTNADPDPADEP